jgi:hypothetical protein
MQVNIGNHLFKRALSVCHGENEYARALHYNWNIKMILHTHENDKKNQFDLVRSK